MVLARIEVRSGMALTPVDSPPFFKRIINEKMKIKSSLYGKSGTYKKVFFLKQ